MFLVNCRIVSTYLVHHGYCATAEAFAKSTGQSFTEEMASIKNRQSELCTGVYVECVGLH